MYEDDYIRTVIDILKNGQIRNGRNGETKSLFAKSLEFDLQEEFPLLLGRRIYYAGVLGELAAMLRGPKHATDFEKFGCNYWRPWCNPDGSIIIDYGNLWRDFDGYNQLEALVKSLKEDPNSRRHIVTGWDPRNLDRNNLPCCHLYYQWYVRNDEYLDMFWMQRSADWMIGVPSDAILAAAWNIILANEVGYKPGKISMMFTDAHIYAEHYDKVEVYLQQFSELNHMDIPYYELMINEPLDHTVFKPGWIFIKDYNPADPIKFEVKA